MKLVFGGAYQGKLDYVKEEFGIKDEEVYSCEAGRLDFDFSKKVIDNLEVFIFSCVKAGKEAKDVLAGMKEELSDKILIADDVSQGLVPMDKDEREFREMDGRALLYLGRECETVVRVFCGIGKKLKDGGEII